MTRSGPIRTKRKGGQLPYGTSAGECNEYAGHEQSGAQNFIQVISNRAQIQSQNIMMSSKFKL